MCCTGQVCNCVFLKLVLDLIETNGEDNELVLSVIRFILSLNLRFDSPHENPIMLTLVAVNEQISCRELMERLILLFNRSGRLQRTCDISCRTFLLSLPQVDPVECKSVNSVTKFFLDLFGEQGTTSDSLLFDSDRRLLIEIISRELSDRAVADEVRILDALTQDGAITSVSFF